MRVLLVEDHPIVVSGCRAVFLEDADLEFIVAGTLRDARAAMAATPPDVIVVDINLPDGSGLDFSLDLVENDPAAKVILFTMSDAPVLAMQAIEGGAKGYVSKNGDPECLKTAVYAVARGERWLAPNIMQDVALLRVDASKRTLTLSERQIRVLKSLVRGSSMAEIAAEIDVCYKTVAGDCAAIRSKLNARTNSEMVRIAAELKLV
ncbi:MAG: response regulator transcription factor [Hyphomicrobium sp.]